MLKIGILNGLIFTQIKTRILSTSFFGIFHVVMLGTNKILEQLYISLSDISPNTVVQIGKETELDVLDTLGIYLTITHSEDILS